MPPLEYAYYRDFARKNQTGLFLFLGLLVLVGLFYWFYRLGKRSQQGKTEELPNSGSGIPQGWSAEQVAQRFYDAMNGWAANKPELEIVSNELLGFTDDQIVAVYNAWQNNYFAKYNKQSLPEVFAKEWCDVGIIPGTNAFTCKSQEAVLAKFNKALGAARAK